ncbi:hypothetical protein ACFU7Y_15430 [Kitasatospora sp. NPDC057542]|nr:hypothetical protein [Streptomyces sp. LS1784]
MRDLLPPPVTRDERRLLFKDYRPDGEGYPNAAARERVAAFCGVPQG